MTAPETTPEEDEPATTGEFRFPLEPNPLRGEWGTVVLLDGTEIPAGLRK